MAANPKTFAYWYRGELLDALGGTGATTGLAYWSRGEVYDSIVGAAPSTTTVSLTLGNLVINAAESEQAATGALTLGNLTPAAATVETFIAVGAVVLGDLVPAGVSLGQIAAGALILDALVVAGAVVETFSAAGVLVFGNLVINGSAGSISAAGALTLGGLVITGGAAQTLTAGTLTLSNLSISSAIEEHLGPPTVTSVSPDVIGALVLVTVFGTNFLTATSVTFGGYPSFLPPTILSNTELTVFVQSPFYLSGGGENIFFGADVVVTNNDGASAPNAPVDQVTLLAPPVVTGISATVFSAADGVVTLTLTGYNFFTAFLLKFFDQDVSTAISVNADGTVAMVTLIDMAAIVAAMGSGVYVAQFWNLAGPSAFDNLVVFLIGGAPFAFGAIDDALSGRYGKVVIRYRYERRKRDFTFIQDITKAFIVPNGTTIHLDNDQAVSRTADFLIRADQLPLGFTGSMASGECVAVWADVLVLGSYLAFCLGLFHLDQPTRTQHPLGYEEWQAKGSDITVVLANRATTAAYVVKAGAHYAAAARALISSFNLRLGNWYDLGGDPATPADFSWPPKTVYLQLIAELLFGINNYPVWADNEGRITTQPRVEPAKNPPAVIYQESAEPRMIVPPSTVTPQQIIFANYVNVGIDNAGRPVYAASFTNADPSSQISTVASGRFEPMDISGSGSPSGKALLDGPTADAVAKYELQEEATRAVERTLITHLDPRRTNREYYQLQLEAYEGNTLWRVMKWDYQCWPGGVMAHVLGTAAPVAIGAGPPSLTQIVRRIGTFARGDIAPLNQASALTPAFTIPVTTTIPAGHQIVLVLMADHPSTSLPPSPFSFIVDSQNNTWSILASTTNYSSSNPFAPPAVFGIAGNHPVANAGEFALIVLAATIATPLVGGIDAIEIHLGAVGGTADVYWASGAAWEVQVAASPSPDGAFADAVASDGSGLNTLTTADSGLSGRTTGTSDLIIGVAGGLWSTADPTLTHTFTPGVGQGWDATQAVALAMPSLSGVYPWLFIQLQIATGPGQFRLSGAFGRPCAAWGAAVVALRGLTL